MKCDLELEFLTLLEQNQQYSELIRIVEGKNKSLCNVLGQAEKLAQDKLDFFIEDGVKYFKINEVRSLFIGLIICRRIFYGDPKSRKKFYEYR